MNKIIIWIGIVFGVLIFMLGFLDLTQTRFGYFSHYFTMGILLIGVIYFKDVTGNIKNRLDKLEANKNG